MGESAEQRNGIRVREMHLAAFVGSIARGDQEALGAFYDQTSASVYSLALQILKDRPAAEEVTLDVYTQVHRQAGHYDPARGAPSAWLLTLTRSRAIDRRRADAQQRKREQNLDSIETLRALTADPEQAFIYFSDDPPADLEAYAGTYLQEEVVAEGATRNVPAFSRFLRVAAFANATIVNFTNVASDAQVARTTVYEYFEILRDTLVVHELPAWRQSKKRKPLVSSKYYFFDVGVLGTLQGRPFRVGTPEWGEALETYLLHELVSYRDYRSGDALAYWRSTSGFEVDFVIGDHTAVEIKATANVSAGDVKGLRALAEEERLKRYVFVCLEPRPRRVGRIDILPLPDFLGALWTGEIA